MVFDMQDMDTIRFDNKSEIEKLMCILAEWQSEHGTDTTAQKLMEMLNEIRQGTWD